MVNWWPWFNLNRLAFKAWMGDSDLAWAWAKTAMGCWVLVLVHGVMGCRWERAIRVLPNLFYALCQVSTSFGLQWWALLPPPPQHIIQSLQWGTRIWLEQKKQPSIAGCFWCTMTCYSDGPGPRRGYHRLAIPPIKCLKSVSHNG